MALTAPVVLPDLGLPLVRKAPRSRDSHGNAHGTGNLRGKTSIGCLGLGAWIWRKPRDARRKPPLNAFGQMELEDRRAFAEDEGIGIGKVRLPLDEWLKEVTLHADLADDVIEKFGHVSQQADEVVEDVVERIQSGAQRCVAPSATVHPFGSTVNGFGEETSDLDVLVAIKEEELSYYMSYASWSQRHQRLSEFLMQGEPAEPSLPTKITPKAAMSHAVQQLADFLPELGFKVLDLIPQARKPLVTVEDTKGPLKEVDVSINNSLPLYNSKLLKAYSLLDERVRPLVLLVKVWAKGKRVCGAGTGNLSSYSWTIMVIYFLQLIGVLPSLQLLCQKSRSLQHVDYWGVPRSFETGFLTAEEYQQEVSQKKIPPCQAKADLTVAQLLYGFVRFFDREYQWGSEAVSMRQPDRRDVGDWFRLFGSIHPEAAIHVEDPIEFRDLNIVLRRERLAQLKEEFNHAVQMLEDGCSLEEFLTRDPRPDVVMTPIRTRRRFQNRNRRRHKSLELPRLPELK